MDYSAPTVPHRAALCLGVVQFFLAASWAVYAIYLPQLAGQAGIAPKFVPWILLADQVVFVFADFTAGVFVDRTLAAMRRVAPLLVGATIVSCTAFLLLPFISPRGADMQWAFLLLTFVWALSSAALRAPLFALLGRYASDRDVPWLSSLVILGIGIAAAIAPYLAAALKVIDPRMPFALASAALLLATAGIVWAERNLVSAAAASGAGKAAPGTPAFGSPGAAFLFGTLVLAIGFQVHWNLNTSKQYLRFAQPQELEHLLPVFWIGFNLVMLPATVLTRRHGGLALAGAAAVLGSAALYLAANATLLNVLLAAQFVGGAAWGCILMSAITGTISLGRTGREGTLSGAFMAVLALAAAARIGVGATGLNVAPAVADKLGVLPAAAWLLGGALLVALSVARGPARAVQ
jgi:hypothetical protein